MAFSIAMWVRDTALKLKQQGIELDRMAISRIGNNHQHGVYTNSNIENNPWKTKNTQWAGRRLDLAIVKGYRGKNYGR